jgi:hypothetical protein
MQNVMNTRISPNIDRISILSATILLAYTLTGLINLPTRVLSAQLPGFYLELQINIQTIVSLLVAGLAASGTDWLLREHPTSQNRRMIQHWLLPALTAWVIGVPMIQQDLGIYWWLGIFMGGGAIVLVLMAEFTVVDPDDVNYQRASIGLTIVAYALLFLLTTTLKANQLRLYLLVPAITVVTSLISLRILHLRLRGQWTFIATGISTLIVAEIATVAHYLPLSPVAFGLLILGSAYALTSLFGNFGEGKPTRESFVEPLAVLLIFWILALVS